MQVLIFSGGGGRVEEFVLLKCDAAVLINPLNTELNPICQYYK